MPKIIADITMKHIAEKYIDLLGGDMKSRMAFIACAASLRLDDEIAGKSVELVAKTNGTTQEILQQIKKLGCVWSQWDGTWYLAEDVRSYLLDKLEEEVPDNIRLQLRNLLASHADNLAESFSRDGQISAYRNRQAQFEAAYQRILIPEQIEHGAKQFADIWRKAKGTANRATADAVDYLSPEMTKTLHRLPPEILFLRGMSARSRGDKRGAESYFRAVWENGRKGYIYAIAAHLFGLLVRDPKIAEKAFRDSIKWNDDPSHKAQVWHSLGNLLSRNRKRWTEAEHAYNKSIQLDENPSGKAQVWHSLGNLLSKDRKRWTEAENAYNKSIQLRDDPSHEGQVWHSLGNLLSMDRKRWAEAENAYNKSIQLRDDLRYKGQVYASWADGLFKSDTPENYDKAEEFALKAFSLDPENPKTCGVANRVLANIYEFRGDVAKAIEMLEALMETDRKLGKTKYKERLQARIDKLRKQIS
ncbi:MAG: hypothetical protein GY749_14005 [Desulfobacteraceae bacterium]|nr:hypothetical protein [Desulfobacteraceae bacterium]